MTVNLHVRPECGGAFLQFKRQALDDDAFFGYWKDVHGPYIAAVPWPVEYRQLHFKYFRDGLWPAALDAQSPPFEYRTCGIAQFSFPSQALYAQWLKDCMEFAEGDHFNMFSKPAEAYTWGLGRRIVYRAGDQAKNVETRLVAFVQAAGDMAACTDFLTATFCPLLAGVSATAKLELTVFDSETIAAASGESGSIHTRDPDAKVERYAAMLEIDLDSAATWRAQYVATLAQMDANINTQIRAIHAYELRSSLPLVESGNLTLAGMLGEQRAALVSEVGAHNIIAMLDAINAKRRAALAAFKPSDKVPPT